MNRDRPEDLFDVFQPWNPARADAEAQEPERPPWEPPPPASAKSSEPEAEEVSRSDPLGLTTNYTADGAVEPGMVLLDEPASSTPRGRVGPRIPEPTIPKPPPDPMLQPGQFIRTLGIPEVTRILKRLEDEGHRGNIQDLLDLGWPSMRVLLWPKPNLLARTNDRFLATLELAVEPEEGNERVISHYYIGPREQSTELAQIPLETLSRQWIVEQVLEFVKLVLERA